MKYLLSILLALQLSCVKQEVTKPVQTVEARQEPMIVIGPPVTLTETIVPSPEEKPPLLAVMFEINEFSEEYVSALVKAIQQINAGTRLFLRINTNGGSILHMMTLAQALEDSNSPVVCVVDWRAFSAGAYLLEQPGCRVRLATRRASILFHEASSGEQGTEHDLQEEINILHVLTRSLVIAASDRIGMSENVFADKIYNKNWIMNFDDALKANVIDKIIDPMQLPALTPIVVEKKSLFELFNSKLDQLKYVK